jgi:hypothetical protein
VGQIGVRTWESCRFEAGNCQSPSVMYQESGRGHQKNFFALTRELRPTIIPTYIALAPKFADFKDLEGSHRETHVGTLPFSAIMALGI